MRMDGVVRRSKALREPRRISPAIELPVEGLTRGRCCATDAGAALLARRVRRDAAPDGLTRGRWECGRERSGYAPERGRQLAERSKGPSFEGRAKTRGASVHMSFASELR
jgi:hypothetical protein